MHHQSVSASLFQALDHLSGFNNFNKSIILSGGATSLILSSMMSFPTNAKLLSHAISALSTLASNIYACKSIVKQGGTQLVVECMTTFPHQMKLLAKARHCIDLLKRVEREYGAGNNSTRTATIHFVRCILHTETKRDTKLIGYCGMVEYSALYQSIASTFEIAENLVRVRVSHSSCPCGPQLFAFVYAVYPKEYVCVSKEYVCVSSVYPRLLFVYPQLLLLYPLCIPRTEGLQGCSGPGLQ